jgi:hypothetical protein
LIALSAAARGSSRLPETQRPLPAIQSVTELEEVADFPPDYDEPEIPESEAEVVVSLVSTPEPLNESQRQVVEFWRAWRSQAVEALPEFLREKTEHRASIEETYQMALRNVGIGEGADVEFLDVSIISRPPVGGYDIGGIGFTDIDDPGYDLRAETFHTLLTMDPYSRTSPEWSREFLFKQSGGKATN